MRAGRLRREAAGVVCDWLCGLQSGQAALLLSHDHASSDVGESAAGQVLAISRRAGNKSVKGNSKATGGGGSATRAAAGDAFFESCKGGSRLHFCLREREGLAFVTSCG